MKINFVGQIFGTSGYTSHCKGLLNALYDLNSDVFLDCQTPPGFELQCNDKELAMVMNGHFDDGETVMVTLPNQWPLGLVEQQKSFNGFCVWEGTEIPMDFLKHLCNADKVLVPSVHVKTAIEHTCADVLEGDELYGVKMPDVHIIPHGVDVDLFKPLDKPELFTFVANSGWAQGIKDRKGVQFLIKAFCEEFKKEEKVELRLKINPAYNNPQWNLQDELDKLGLSNEKPIMRISTDSVDFKYMPQFYQGDCFVSPTMGDAFNIPCAEAMSCGLPVITTGFGGQTDFVSKDNGWLIDYKLQEVTHDVMYEGVSWAVPDIKHLRKLMRYAFEHRSECKKKGKLARKTIEEGFTWKKSAEKLLEVLSN